MVKTARRDAKGIKFRSKTVKSDQTGSSFVLPILPKDEKTALALAPRGFSASRGAKSARFCPPVYTKVNAIQFATLVQHCTIAICAAGQVEESPGRQNRRAQYGSYADVLKKRQIQTGGASAARPRIARRVEISRYNLPVVILTPCSRTRRRSSAGTSRASSSGVRRRSWSPMMRRRIPTGCKPSRTIVRRSCRPP
jgi:hypothetical protein